MRVYVKSAINEYLDVQFTRHCSDIRTGEIACRKACLVHTDYLRVMKAAYLNGMLSFKGKHVVVTIANADFSQQVSILCDVISYSKIRIITIKHHWAKWDKHRIDFIRVRNRVNLYNFDFKLTTLEQSKQETYKSALHAV